MNTPHTRTIRSIEWVPGQRKFATCSFDGTTCVFKQGPTGYEVIATLEGHEHEVKHINWNHDGTLLATCSRDKNIWIWSTNEDDDFECNGVLSGHSQDIKYVKWHPTKNLLFSASYDDTIKCWMYDENIDDWNL